MSRLVDCPVCLGHGETAVPGTFGPTISPERLELIRCWLCEGIGEVTPARADNYWETHDDYD